MRCSSDTALILGYHAVIASGGGIASGETGSTAAGLQNHFELHRIERVTSMAAISSGSGAPSMSGFRREPMPKVSRLSGNLLRLSATT
jgi:hypothetical protein